MTAAQIKVVLGCLLIFAVTAVAYSRLPGTREAGAFAFEPRTPYFRYSNGNTRGRILVVHGLNASKSMMNMLSFALADAGFEVFSIDLPGHGSSNVAFNGVLAGEAVARALDTLGPDTNVVGHSLGGALLLDVASTRPVGNMVLFSPVPTPVQTIMAARTLLFYGQFDLGRIRAFSSQVEAAGEGGVVEFHDLAWTGHSGALMKPRVIRMVAEWLGGDAARIRLSTRLVLLLLMLVSSMGLGIALFNGAHKITPSVASVPLTNVLTVSYAGAAGAAAAVLAFFPVARWLHLFATDYLMGFLFVTGAILSLGRTRIRILPNSLLIGVAAAVYVIAIPGFLVLSEFAQMTLPDGRWWRFPAIFILGLPLCLADEVLIRPIAPRWKGLFGLILTRLLLWAMTVSATLLWNREASFLLLIVHILVIFWIVLWFLGGLVYRRTKDPLATAVFTSILQAWVFAALFVTT